MAIIKCPHCGKPINKVFSQFGKTGGAAIRKRYGKAYFARLGKLGMQKRWGAKRKADGKAKKR